MAEKKEQVFAEGLRFFDKHSNAPDFVKGTIVITLDELFAFTKANPQYITDYKGKKQIKLQQLESKEGSTYFTVDTYKKDDNAPAKTYQAKPIANQAPPDEMDDLPF